MCVDVEEFERARVEAESAQNDAVRIWQSMKMAQAARSQTADSHDWTLSEDAPDWLQFLQGDQPNSVDKSQVAAVTWKQRNPSSDMELEGTIGGLVAMLPHDDVGSIVASTSSPKKRISSQDDSGLAARPVVQDVNRNMESPTLARRANSADSVSSSRLSANGRQGESRNAAELPGIQPRPVALSCESLQPLPAVGPLPAKTIRLQDLWSQHREKILAGQ